MALVDKMSVMSANGNDNAAGCDQQEGLNKMRKWIQSIRRVRGRIKKDLRHMQALVQPAPGATPRQSRPPVPPHRHRLLSQVKR